MSEHSIEELERQLQSARDRVRQAQIEEREAAKRLQDATDAASGIMGHVLEYSYGRGWGVRKLRVERVTKNWSDALEAHGHFIIADGSVGAMTGRVEVSKATDLGPYVAPAKKAAK